ncbi:hypothetical protein DFH27DRAFT_552554 [Peziza echinospora]|nr:hypothetical protein DFH27DRAFT_552554 [Peziza echinospora]
MKLLISLSLIWSLISIALASDLKIDFAQYKIDDTRTAYGFKSMLKLPDRPTEQIMIDLVKEAMEKMQAAWKALTPKPAQGIPHVISLFWPGDDDMMVYIHSSVKNGGPGAPAIAKFGTGLHPELDRALAACLEDKPKGHTNSGNCAEIILLNKYATLKKIKTFKTMTDALIVAATWSTKTNKAHIMAPCEGTTDDAFGCRDVLRELGVMWCDWRGEAMQRRALPARAVPVISARGLGRPAARVSKRAEVAQTAAQQTALVGMKRTTCTPPFVLTDFSGPVAGAVCPRGMRMRIKREVKTPGAKAKAPKAAGKAEVVCEDPRKAKPKAAAGQKPAAGQKVAAAAKPKPKAAAQKVVAPKPKVAGAA